jgi:phenylalanine ammonia-lyase
MSTSETRTQSRRRSSVGVVRVVASPLRPSMAPSTHNAPTKPVTLLANFLASFQELEGYRSGKPVILDGQTLSIAAVTAASRYNASIQLDASPTIKNRVQRSRAVMHKKVEEKSSIYGVSTGFGGSADTRTDQPLVLGNALLQLLHAGVLPSDTTKPLDALPLLDPLHSTSMPESWVRLPVFIM